MLIVLCSVSVACLVLYLQTEILNDLCRALDHGLVCVCVCAFVERYGRERWAAR